MTRTTLRALAAAALIAATPALADGPEQLDQVEPGRGEWQLEYSGFFGGEGEQGLEAMIGLTDRLAIGAEAEFEGPRDGLRFGGASATALYRFADPEQAPLGVGAKLSAAIDRRGGIAGAEARLIVERRSRRWWLQGDAMLRHARESHERGTGIAYAASAQHALGEGVWLGIEASGQAVRLSGDAELAPQGRHYVGPSLRIGRELGEDREVEIGLAWFQRVKGEGAPSGPRIFVQFSL